MKPLTALGLGLVLAGVLLILLSFTQPWSEVVPNATSSNATGFAGCVIIFFIPICFGEGNISPTLLEVTALVVFAVFAVFMIAILHAYGRRPETPQT